MVCSDMIKEIISTRQGGVGRRRSRQEYTWSSVVKHKHKKKKKNDESGLKVGITVGVRVI